MSKLHQFATDLATRRLSPYYRELLTYVGQLECYDLAAELVNKLLRRPTNVSQVFRQTTKIGEQASELINKEPTPKEVEPSDLVYVQVDGSMLLTREEKWKEVKVGRMFFDSALYQLSPKRRWIKNSLYIAHLGSHEAFEMKMSRLVDPYYEKPEQLVFVTDGASWISSWINAEYPKATQILDFYHAMEHLGHFAKAHFKESLERDYWIEENRTRLKTQGVKCVMKVIKELHITKKQTKQERKMLLQYYRKNQYRMNYPEYLEKGYLIGSGAIEAAHRTLVQKRMKLSGQRWSKNGAQKMLNLRALHMSQRWDEVENLFRYGKAA